jgi:hypothetical protein
MPHAHPDVPQRSAGAHTGSVECTQCPYKGRRVHKAPIQTEQSAHSAHTKCVGRTAPCKATLFCLESVLLRASAFSMETELVDSNALGWRHLEQSQLQTVSNITCNIRDMCVFYQ